MSHSTRLLPHLLLLTRESGKLPYPFFNICNFFAKKVKDAQSCPTLCDSMDCIVHGILQAKILESFTSPGDLPNPGIEPRSPTLQADSLPGKPQGQPKNTEVGSLSFLQQIFPTWELNWGLLHCRWILYQQSYQGSPAGTLDNLKRKREKTKLLMHLYRVPSEKAMAPHSSTLAWKILRTEEPGRLKSMGSLRVGHD